MREGTVWIAEDWDRDDSSYWSGQFSAHWDGPDGAFEEGPQYVSHADAIAWGRSRADIVLIRSAESGYHSAGVRQPDDGPLPEWPINARFERRRPTALAYMDRTEADDPILWAVTLTLSLGQVELGDFPAAFTAAVGEEPDVVDLVPYVDPGSHSPSSDYSDCASESNVVHARFKLSARTCEQVEQRAHQIAMAAMKAAGPELRGAGAWYLSANAVPTDD